MEDPSLVSCGADPGLVCPFVDNYSIEPAPPTVFSTAPVGSHPAIRIPCREQEEETCMYLNVFIGKKILFIDDEPRGPFLFLYEDAAGKPVAVCTRQTPIPRHARRLERPLDACSARSDRGGRHQPRHWGGGRDGQ
jgi:hypothetical protein